MFTDNNIIAFSKKFSKPRSLLQFNIIGYVDIIIKDPPLKNGVQKF